MHKTKVTTPPKPKSEGEHNREYRNKKELEKEAEEFYQNLPQAKKTKPNSTKNLSTGTKGPLWHGRNA